MNFSTITGARLSRAARPRNPNTAKPNPRPGRRTAFAEILVDLLSRPAGIRLLPFLAASILSSTAGEINFRADILPILSKAGCNAGACHGAATGQGGFRLSLLGYDPDQDYWNITREFSARRVDLDKPAESLFLRKPAYEIDHDGGRKIRRGSEEYRMLLRWIERGVPRGSPDLLVTGLAVEPADRLLAAPDDEIQLRVTAYHSDGTARDVTSLALYTSNNDAVAEVTPEGSVTALNPGLTSIMVRYSGQVGAARIALPYPVGDDSHPEFPTYSFIDSHVAAELERLRIPSSPLSRDWEFLRRVYLDLTGRLPEAAAVQEFRGDRLRLIEALLASEEFIDFWTLKFADLFLISGRRGKEESARVYHAWLREQLSRGAGWDEIASALLTGSGSITESGPANFYTLATDPRDMAEHASRIFLGTQLACARCHAHPSDRWTQKDYYQFSAFFAQVTRDGNTIQPGGRGEVGYPKSGLPALPKPLGAERPLAAGDKDRRVALAEWMVDPENGRFSRAIVNRVWKELLGRGLVEPVDDLRPTNPPTHPALLDELSSRFAGHGFDLRWLIREITSSATYQLSSRTVPGNERDDRFYSHALLKPLPPPVLADAIAQVTGVPDRFDGYPAGTHAVQLITPQAPSYSLDVLGRCDRERTCDTSTKSGGGIAAALHLINGEIINSKLGHGILPKLRADLETPEIIRELYMRALARHPGEEELSFWLKMIEQSPSQTGALEDFLWTLLNCREFAFNH